MTRLLRLVALAAALLSIAPATASAARVFAVTPTALTSFDSQAAGVSLGSVPLSGLAAGETIVGIDLRPATGELLAITRTAGSGAGRLRVLDPVTGALSSGVVLAADPADASAPYVSLPNASFGVDVNPFNDRLRVVSDTDANLRITPDTGAVTTDVAINPAAPSVNGVAYTNNRAGAPSTTLYAFDFFGDRLGFLNPPNAGTFTEVGPTGVTAESGELAHLDIAPDGAALALQRASGTQRLYSVELATGAYRVLGTPIEQLLVGMAAANNVTRFGATEISASEGAGVAELTVVREDPAGASSVPWTATPGSAGAADTPATSGTLAFAPGESAKTLSIPLTDDGADEPAESFTVTLSTAPDTPVVAPRTAAVTIRDDDPQSVTATERVEVPGPERVRIVPVPVPAPTASLLSGRCANPRAGTAGDDALAGTPAGDRLTGLGGADGLSGAAGDDCLLGGAGDDLLSGGPGADDLRGDGGADVLLGGPGADRLTGGGGANVLRAGAGADVISARNRRRDVVDCGPGRDRVTADRADRLRGCEVRSVRRR